MTKSGTGDISLDQLTEAAMQGGQGNQAVALPIMSPTVTIGSRKCHQKWALEGQLVGRVYIQHGN